MPEKCCKNCRHWEKEKGSDYNTWGHCPEIFNKIDVIIDGDATASLDIEEDFCCIFFKEK